MLAGGKDGVGPQTSAIRIDRLLLKKDNCGRPTGNGVAGRVTPGNTEENTSAGDELVRAKMS